MARNRTDLSSCALETSFNKHVTFRRMRCVCIEAFRTPSAEIAVVFIRLSLARSTDEYRQTLRLRLEKRCGVTTSGGYIFRGSHLLTHWSWTQQVVALSSAEAELHMVSQCATDGLSLRNLCREVNMMIPLKVVHRCISSKRRTNKTLGRPSLWAQEREK